MSRPVWGAWIEMRGICTSSTMRKRRAPYGARGLKCSQVPDGTPPAKRRAPYGARGLKYVASSLSARSQAVAPRMGRVD